MLELVNLSKSYADQPVLDGVSLCIDSHRTSVLIGPSGCGKSTILRLITGLIPADTGRILLDGQEINAASISVMRRQMGYVIQDGGLFPHLSALDNICLFPRYAGWEQSRIQTRMAELQDLFRFSHTLLNRYPAELSGGQKQRVSLMRAMMPDPGLLLLDEPLVSLDPMIRYELQEDLRSIFQQLDKTVLLVTHDMGEAGYLGDHIILFQDGGVAQQGTMQDLLHHPASGFVEKFIRAQRQPWQHLQEIQ